MFYGDLKIEPTRLLCNGCCKAMAVIYIFISGIWTDDFVTDFDGC